MASSSFGANTPELRTRYGRKRLKMASQWKRKKIKLLKDSGKEYTTYTGALKPAKELIDLSCGKYHCQAKLNKERVKLFTDFYKLSNYDAQNKYFFGLLGKWKYRIDK